MLWSVSEHYQFFYRNSVDCLRYLVSQPADGEDLVNMPRREQGQRGQKIYAEMHTADWWWEVQVLLCSLFYIQAC